MLEFNATLGHAMFFSSFKSKKRPRVWPYHQWVSNGWSFPSDFSPPNPQLGFSVAFQSVGPQIFWGWSWSGSFQMHQNVNTHLNMWQFGWLKTQLKPLRKNHQIYQFAFYHGFSHVRCWNFFSLVNSCDNNGQKFASNLREGHCFLGSVGDR